MFSNISRPQILFKFLSFDIIPSPLPNPPSPREAVEKLLQVERAGRDNDRISKTLEIFLPDRSSRFFHILPLEKGRNGGI